MLGGFTEFYFDTEVALEPEMLELSREGGKVDLTPESCRIITMQFQLLDRSGLPASPLMVMREWENEGGEEGMIRKFVEQNLSADPWEFIPVGHNVLFDLGLLKARAEKYGIELNGWELYHQRPYIDIRQILLGMNGFAFRKSGLDQFCAKRNGKEVPFWYEQAQKGDERGFALIDEYIEQEAEEFVRLYSRLKSELPKLRVQMQLFNSNGKKVKV
ncbi:hypothetical protein DRN67_00740 [Candidatus Micrarchaeota archaeon]|nr:MAG: hypothetical protein DRN67_00740 [Candidatus Micrarchaeota archaeon]